METIDTSKKMQNTLVMMGVHRMKAVFVDDALKSMRNIVNKDVEAAYRKIVLDTEVMGKTFKQWFEHFKKQASTMSYTNEMGIRIPFRPSEFDVNKAELHNLLALVNLVLQEYYKKEYKL